MAKKVGTTVVLRVTVSAPGKVTMPDLCTYVRDAVKSYRGGMNPNDPMFNLDSESVTVSITERHTIYQ